MKIYIYSKWKHNYKLIFLYLISCMKILKNKEQRNRREIRWRYNTRKRMWHSFLFDPWENYYPPCYKTLIFIFYKPIIGKWKFYFLWTCLNNKIENKEKRIIEEKGRNELHLSLSLLQKTCLPDVIFVNLAWIF